jgi:hypothetical protein
VGFAAENDSRNQPATPRQLKTINLIRFMEIHNQVSEHRIFVISQYNTIRLALPVTHENRHQAAADVTLDD